MKNKNRPVPHLLVILFVVFASMIIFMSSLQAQQVPDPKLGTQKNADGSTTEVERDATYDPDGRKATTKDPKGKVIKVEYTGGLMGHSMRDVYERTTYYYDMDYADTGGRTITKETFDKTQKDDPQITHKTITELAGSGKVISEIDFTYENGVASGRKQTVSDPESGKKMTIEEKYSLPPAELKVTETKVNGKKVDPKDIRAKEEEVQAFLSKIIVDMFDAVKKKKNELKKEAPTKDATPKKTVSAGSFPGFTAGKYIGTVTIEHLDKCEEFAWGKLNNPPGRSSTDVFLTVGPQATVMKIEYDEGNTKSADWFETNNTTLTVTSNHMVGGNKDAKTVYTFDITFTYDSAAKEYTGTGTWGYHDNCEKEYPVTLALKAQ